MKENLLQLVSEFQKDKRLIAFDEAATKQAIILRLLSILGWNIYRIDEIHPEYTVGGKRVDYALKINGHNKVFVEVKRVGEDLEKHQQQLLNYSFQEGVPTAILTNGITWWFYLPLLEGNWENRRFYTIEIYDQNAEDMASKFIDFLSKAQVESGKALEKAKTVHKSRQKSSSIRDTLPKAWNKLLSDPDETLMDLIADTTEKICGYRPDNPTVEEFILSKIRPRKDEVKPKQTEAPVTTISKSYVRPRGDYRHKSVSSFQIKGRTYQVKNWKDLLLKVAKILHENQGAQFSQVLRLRGRKRPYFSKDPRELFRGVQIPGSDIYAETNFSANYIVKMCSDMIGLFGYSENDFSIELR